PSRIVRFSMAMRHGAERLELCLEQRLVDLALVDRNALLDTEADHFLPVDPELLGKLVRREVVCHDAPVLEQQKARRRCALARADSKLPRGCRQESRGLPP